MTETKPARTDHGAYVRKVQEDTQNFAQGLIGEVERLRLQVAALESEKEGLAAQLRDVETVIRVNDALRAQIEGIKAETEGYSSRYAAVEQQNSNLANLYVASYRLHGTLDRGEVISAVQEIIANLIGSEEAALFEIDPDTKTLELVASFGVDRDQCPPIPVGSGLIGLTARTGEILVVDPSQASGATGLESRLTACIPLKLDGTVTGVIAIFGLLPQKGGIEDLDRELFDLLATQAAFALYCTGLHAKVALEVARRW
ncbi:MAG TPA: GAF domain-containing protein [Vicinamibacteria bacterium]|nr:GAF domain-containing protein [Vicinamibacteria bacterium]